MTRRVLGAALALVALAPPAAASAAAPSDVALDYVREHRRALGLDAVDIDALRPPTVTRGGAITTVRFRQAVDGIPAADADVRVNLGPDGRVLSVLGDPEHDLDAATTPTVTAGEAVRAVQAATGAFRSATVEKVAPGATRSTSYSDGTVAELALDDRRLVWRVTSPESSVAVWDAFVDARSGGVRRRFNLVKSAVGASVWETTPKATLGGAATTVDLAPWLTSTTRLLGPNVRAFADLDDDDVADAGEEVVPGAYSLAEQPLSSGCLTQKPCTWSPGSTLSWDANRRQNAVQAFATANRFRDHLAAAPIGFTGIGGDDPVILQTDDGAATGPDVNHVSNANMLTPSDGRSPVMQMYLWRGPSHRAVNGGDDASIVDHEFTHGLTNRLVTDAAGRGALNSPQAGALGEGWSDWYAKDYLVARFPGLDVAGVAGDVDMGDYVDVVAHSLRTQGLDCPVGVASVACPGTPTAGSGGYTYGDLGRIAGGQEVHADGEIWAETLWDLRAAVGSAAAERVITDGLRLTPPEPSFLDARNAILLADQAVGGTLRTTLWSVFAARGMGFYATADEVTGNPVESFALPPAGARGRLAGTVVDAASLAGLAGARASIAGLASGPDALTAATDAAGAFAIEGVPAGMFPSLVFSAPGYDSVTQPVSVPAGSTAVAAAALQRNWAALPGGATVTPGPGSADYADLGCGPEAALDQRSGSGWSTDAAPGGKSMVVTLPAAVDVSAFVVNPTETCGDDAGSAAAGYVIETAPTTADGPWTRATSGTFSSEDRRRLNTLPAAAAGVRSVRVTLLSSQAGGAFFDLTEFGVRGTLAQTPAQPPPTPTPAPPPAPAPTPVAPAIAAPTFSFPPRGRTTVKFKVTCAARCDVTAKLTVDRPTAKRLGLGRSLTAGELTRSGVRAGTTELTLKLKSKARKALLKGPKRRTYRARIRATATYGAGTSPATRSAQLTLKR